MYLTQISLKPREAKKLLSRHKIWCSLEADEDGVEAFRPLVLRGDALYRDCRKLAVPDWKSVSPVLKLGTIFAEGEDPAVSRPSRLEVLDGETGNWVKMQLLLTHEVPLKWGQLVATYTSQ